MDGSRTILNGAKFASRLHLENVLLNLLLIFFVNVLLKKNIISLELQVITTAILQWENAQATLSPTPSYTLSSSAHIIKPSPPANNSLSSETSQGKNQLNSQTAAVTETNLEYSQGKVTLLSISFGAKYCLMHLHQASLICFLLFLHLFLTKRIYVEVFKCHVFFH